MFRQAIFTFLDNKPLLDNYFDKEGARAIIICNKVMDSESLELSSSEPIKSDQLLFYGIFRQ
ncbi:MAG: hypothetical protein ABL958_20345, partial [Bdellovibrionia bacterium]